jgi:hypothetical protein
MKRNENNIDRIIRLFLGVVLLYLGYSDFSGLTQNVVYFLSGLFLFTGITGFCAIYSFLGISTTKIANK